MMAPSRGINVYLRFSRGGGLRPANLRRYSDLVRTATDTSRSSLIYISRIHDPYLNLSIEHYLLQKTAPESKVLFLYTNRPSVIIGRNQNPWVEANLSLLKKERLDLVRRRSGGGTVFHDEGNVNYSVICPTAVFDRDKHAQMVVRALRSIGVQNTRVNKRHDIVQDRNGADPTKEDPFSGDLRPFKISGSAYKLTRLRALHHGTCLLSAPNLGRIGQFLKSPSKQYITARGVESVPSEIANVTPHVSNEIFIQAVVSEFINLYGDDEPEVEISSVDVPEITKGYEELTSPEWIYSQTPQFTFSAQHDKDLGITFTARNGAVTEAEIRYAKPSSGDSNFSSKFIGKKLYDTVDSKAEDWVDILHHNKPISVLEKMQRKA